MSQPLIGLTTARYETPEGVSRICISESYVKAVAQAGAVPILIPLGLSEGALVEIAARLDGVVFTGGGDMEPRYYGACNDDPRAGGVDPDRDRVEMALFQAILPRELPFLGICRGLQVINVALGGTLYVDISEDMPRALQHQNGNGQPRDYLAHPVQVDATSQLVRILNAERVSVNSMHHQGIDRLATRLAATAHAPDGLVEAFEMTDYPFGLAVQWHPECLLAHEAMRSLFRAFVESSARRAW